MAVGSPQLARGVEQVSALCDVPAHRRLEKEVDAFSTIRTGVLQSKNDGDALDGLQEKEMADVLELLVKIGTHKPVLKGRVCECLRICLGRPRWFSVAQGMSQLHEPLQSLLGEGFDISVPPELPVASKKRLPLDSSLGEEVVEVVRLLVQSADAMQRYGWEFPHEKLDEPTEAFMLAYNGLRRLISSSRTDKCAAAVVASLEQQQLEWRGVANFLLGMYECGARKAYRARVRDVAERLAELLPTFGCALDAAAAERGDGKLPWTTSPAQLTQGKISPSCASKADDLMEGSLEEEEEGASTPPDLSNVTLPDDEDGLKQQGRYVLHNGHKRELAIYVEQTQQEYRIRGGKTLIIEAGLGQIVVRINYIGLMGWTSLRTRLGKEVLSHMCYYTIVSTADGNACCKLVARA